MWNKRSEEKIRSSFQNNTTQNTTVLGEKKRGKGWKKKGEEKKKKKREGGKGVKKRKKANPTAWVLGSLTLPTHKPVKHFPPIYYVSFFNTTVLLKRGSRRKMIALHLHNCTTREIYQHFWTAKSAKQIVCRTATVTHWSSYHRQHHKCVGRTKSFIIKINHNSHSVPRSLKKKSHKNLSAANLAFSLKNEYQIKREPTAGPGPKRRLSGTKIAQNNVLHSEFFLHATLYRHDRHIWQHG